MSIILAIIIGGLFGFVLDRVGATNPGYIIRMLNLSNLHLLKTIMLAIGTASLLMFLGILSGLVDPGHMSVKTAYFGVFIGGILLGDRLCHRGLLSGHEPDSSRYGTQGCPVLRSWGLVGAAAYMLAYAGVKATGMLEKIAGGSATLGQIEGTDYPF